jgi:hypothetical protein
MMIRTTLLFVLRSWWRNKLFFFTALVSLTVGLTCTNLLFTFFIHEYGIEDGNPEKARIYVLRQDSPMTEGEKVAYAERETPPLLKEKYGEVEEYARFSSLAADYCLLDDGRRFTEVMQMTADSSMLRFFNYRVLNGSLHEALTRPDKIAISKTTARLWYGDTNPIGEHVTLGDAYNGDSDITYEICAVVEERPQSLFHFDLVSGLTPDYFGGLALLKLRAGSDASALTDKINSDKVPTLLPGTTRYYVEPLSCLYFDTSDNGTWSYYIQRSNLQQLYIYLAAALLILLIACFNYANMTLSRTLGQLRMLHVEKLMGSSRREIRLQLFTDAFLTVVLAFALSLLIIHDLLPAFNRLLDVRLEFSFLFSGRMLLYLLLFLLTLSVVPAYYISRRLSRMTLSDYKLTYTGRGKRHLASLLITLQFALSIVLLFAALTAVGQVRLVEHNAELYRDEIEIQNSRRPDLIYQLWQKLKQSPNGIAGMTLGGSPLSARLRYYDGPKADGSEVRSHILQLYADTTLLNTVGIRQLQGEMPDKAMLRYPHVAFVNETYLRHIVPAGVSPIGHLLREYDIEADSAYVIGGVVQDFLANRQEEAIAPYIIYFCAEQWFENQVGNLLLRIDPAHRTAALRHIEQVWQSLSPDKTFSHVDVHQNFIRANNKVITLSQLLSVYSLIGLLLIGFGLFGISWYAMRQRIHEIGIRKIHGANTIQIVWLLWRPFCLQLLMATVVALPLAYVLMQHWREQFVVRAPWTVGMFIFPLLIVAGISLLTLSVHTWLAARSNPAKTIKSE